MGEVIDIEVGDEIELTCESTGKRGDGVAKYKGMVIFIPGGNLGETYLVRITFIGPNFGRGEIIN